MRSGRYLGYGAIIVSALLFGLNGTLSKVVLEAGLPATYLVTLRCTGAALGLVVIVGIVRPGDLRIRRRDLPLIVVCGIAGAAVVQLFYFIAISRLPVGIALLFEFTGPVLVAVWAAVGFPRRSRRRQGPQVWVALGLVLAGLVLVAQVWSDVRLDPLGVLAGFGAAVMVAIYYVCSGHLADRGYAGTTMTMWMYVVGAVFWSIARPWWGFPFDVLGRSSQLGPVWLVCIGVVVLGSIIAYSLIGYALQRLPATTTAIIGTAEPVFAGVFAWVVLDEVLDATQLVGAAVVLAGIVVSQIQRRAREPDRALLVEG